MGSEAWGNALEVLRKRFDKRIKREAKFFFWGIFLLVLVCFFVFIAVLAFIFDHL
jgi:cobalamin biosynthesis protein CobD/CbiB